MLADRNRKNRALGLLPRAQRELVAEILERQDPAVRSIGNSLRDPDEAAFLRLARLRLRNIVGKHAEALKRARRAERSGKSGSHVEHLEEQLWICTEALARCSQSLKQAGEKD